MASSDTLSAPFPYFGGKSKVAETIWSSFGDVRSYIEPFCGSMAVLLHKQEPTDYEIVNDMDGLLTNFWRAIKHEPEGVAGMAACPPSEIEITARHNWVYERKDCIVEMQEDPEWYDVKAAAYWVYVRSTFIGSGSFQGKIGLRLPRLDVGVGIHAACRRGDLDGILCELSDRLERVRIACGSWERVLSKTPLKGFATPTAVFLDPPYQSGEFYDGVYEHANDVFGDVRAWAIEHGDDPELRIALCGYEPNEMPRDWYTVAWKTAGGLGNIGEGGRGRSNRTRERIWFSPHCINPDEVSGTQVDIMDMVGGT